MTPTYCQECGRANAAAARRCIWCGLPLVDKGTPARFEPTRVEIDYLDGITVDNGDWWFNVRKSNTEPMLRLNLEAPTPGQLQERLGELKKFLGEPVHGH